MDNRDDIKLGFKGAVPLPPSLGEQVDCEIGEGVGVVPAIQIKPHHFIDIIKLHGAGISCFVADETYGHDFYRIGNWILRARKVWFQVTVDGDAICVPCRHYSPDGRGICADTISHIEGCSSKDEWNKELDRRIIRAAGLDTEISYTAETLCRILYEIRDAIFEIWREDDLEKTKQRYQLFCEGARQYLGGSFADKQECRE